MIAQAFVAAAIALPWLILFPLHGVAGALASAITFVAALHGAGLVVARLADQRAASPWLVIQWGTATLIGLSGIAIMLGIGTLAGHAALVFAFAAVHTAALALRFTARVRRVDDQLAAPRIWLVPAALLAVLGALALLGAAGDTLVRPFDDEGHVLAQLRRVLDTGALGDPVGYPRSSQLGGQIALAAVAAAAGEGFAQIVEPLGFILGLGLALGLALGLTTARRRTREPASALWAVVLVAAASALAFAPTEPLPCWTAVGLMVALHAMLGNSDPAPALPLAITAGAVITLRYELAPIAAVALLAEWWRRRTDHHRTAILLGGVFAVGFPFLVARMIAWRSVPHVVHAAIAAPQSSIALRLVITAAIAVPAAFLLRLVLPGHRPLRWAATATAIALAAAGAHLTGTGLYSLRLAWPIAIGFAIIVVIELARSRWAGPTALVASLVLCVLILAGRDAPGRLRWSHRLGAAATAIEFLQRPPATGGDPYADLLASVPAGATVAVWVAEPERLDYAHHRIVDLRTPAGARLREFRWPAHASTFAPLLGNLAAAFLLVETDDAAVLRTQTDLLYRSLCQTPRQTQRSICADDLEAIARDHRIVAQRAGVRLVDLRRR